MKGRIYSFTNEDGNTVKFTVKELISIDKTDYVLMSPINDSSKTDVYKFSTVNGGEALELIDNENELNLIRESSRVI